MTTDSLKLGEAKYSQLTPEVREFFDVVSARLADAQVLFSSEMPAISDQANTGWSKNRANSIFTPGWSRDVLLYMNVSLAINVFGPGSTYRRITYFDAQHRPDDLRIEEALLRRKDRDIAIPFHGSMLVAIADWRNDAAGHYAQFMHRTGYGL